MHMRAHCHARLCCVLKCLVRCITGLQLHTASPCQGMHSVGLLCTAPTHKSNSTSRLTTAAPSLYLAELVHVCHALKQPPCTTPIRLINKTQQQHSVCTWLSLKMFFLRSTILRPPDFVSTPMSPVWNQPSSSSTSAVLSGCGYVGKGQEDMYRMGAGQHGLAMLVSNMHATHVIGSPKWGALSALMTGLQTCSQHRNKRASSDRHLLLAA